MASNTSPTSAYRAQNGIAEAGSYDPQVVTWIKQAAAETGADPRALLATSLQEDGARLHAVGDQGTSFGPFQFHVGGALGNHPAQWASTYDAVLNRAHEFARLGVRGGKGAAAVQRPRDQQLYARGVDSLLARAEAILGHHGAGATGGASTPGAPPGRIPATPAGGTIQTDDTDAGDMIVAAMNALHANAQLAHLPGSSYAPTGSTLGDALGRNAALIGVGAPTLPGATAASGALRPPAPDKRNPKPLARSSSASAGPPGRVVAGTPRIIGTPYHGTHTVGNWESDNAVDIAMPAGTPIRAPYSGVVGSQIGSLGSNNPRFAGLRVHLAGAGQELYFAHLSRLAVKAGQQVKAGQIIGYSGVANGVAHLHLGARNGNPGRYA